MRKRSDDCEGFREVEICVESRRHPCLGIFRHLHSDFGCLTLMLALLAWSKLDIPPSAFLIHV